MTRKDFQEISEVRLKESRALLDSGHFSGAYYLAGYAVECALKACIASKTKQYDFPDKTRVEKSWSHDLEGLHKIAELSDHLRQMANADKAFSTNWNLVKDWKEDSRYAIHSQSKANDMIDAVGSMPHGVLQWIKHYW